jgi:hypothetical protein
MHDPSRSPCAVEAAMSELAVVPADLTLADEDGNNWAVVLWDEFDPSAVFPGPW